MPPRLRKWLIRTAQVMAGLIAGLVITELVFWWRDDGAFPHLNVYRPDPVLGVRLVPGSETRIAFGGNPATSVRINREGLRGGNLPAPSAERPEIVVVGDSQVFGLGVEEGQTFSARLAARLGKGTLVINGGVPTYGPGEYRALAAELLDQRKAGGKGATVVFTLNMVNDLFEAGRPNVDRHAVWDGWAVRKESGPGSVTWFPGRHFLYNRSHAFFALRRWWHKRGPALDDRGFSSEGTWADVVESGAQTQARHDEVKQKLETRTAELGATETKLEEAEAKVDFAMRQKLDDVEPFQLRVARANPGDIIGEDPYAEASRDLHVTADQIRKGTAYRAQRQADLLARAKAKGDQAVLDIFATRDGLQRQLALLDAGVDVASIESPLAPVLREVKAMCDERGARLVVLVLPMDVQVSAGEWKKYGVEARDMAATRVLIDDIVVAATAIGVTALDATPALAAAEPGAFLKRDIHMTARGHQAVADALAEALAQAPPAARSGTRAVARSPVPVPLAWRGAREINVKGSSKANCETKRVREWLRVACRRDGNDLDPADLTLTAGDGGSAMIMVMPGATTLTAPLTRGAPDLVAEFAWADHTRTLTVRWPAEAEQPSVGFGEPVTRVRGPQQSQQPGRGPVVDAICRCWGEVHVEQCTGAYGAPDPGCVTAYNDNCPRMLACVLRDPAHPPGPAPAAAPGAAPAPRQAPVQDDPPMQERAQAPASGT